MKAQKSVRRITIRRDGQVLNTKHLILTFLRLTSHRPLKWPTYDAQFDRTSQIRCAAFSANDTATLRTSVGASLPALVAGIGPRQRRLIPKKLSRDFHRKLEEDTLTGDCSEDDEDLMDIQSGPSTSSSRGGASAAQ
ncbi:hypothetical protein TNCV_4179031 [Trichonephila clavipes]|nr:hypothetical protein TNCV_4179031 [Trichonephila clavipes]